MSRKGGLRSQEGLHEAHAWMRSIGGTQPAVAVAYESPGDAAICTVTSYASERSAFSSRVVILCHDDIGKGGWHVAGKVPGR